ncbi:AAA family ATPase [Shinella zoogloeoides]|uniref:AAA family ATPase n=1 Tax=Shinella zoogloeoides TaxID=352475 RepID=UPI00273D925F|nr:AAA family ATPase [Shinella zoogloeoides]WLR94369.1 AAA family ATPase [Shinella zoogloeoides]
MIREIKIQDWKSYKLASIPFDQLTVLIGTNASGKSNALDALEFLSRVSAAADINSAIVGDSNTVNIRGGLEWATFEQGKTFKITVIASGEDEKTDYEYSISIAVEGNSAELESEELVRIKYQGQSERRLRLFWTDDPDIGAPGIMARLYNTKSGTKRPMRRNLSILSQLEIYELREEIDVGVKHVISSIRSIFILDPNPASMRTYSRPSEKLFRDGSNIAGVLSALPKDRKEKVEATISKYAAKIPEKDITRVWAETVDRHHVDAMLYCTERWNEKSALEMDARGMSDGTLRFISVIVALLTQPEGSLIVVEEIDNGLHPSRAVDLLSAIREIGTERKIDLLITTHNVALLDALPPGVLRSVAVATRNITTGASEITILNDLPHLARLVADGSLGQLAAQGKIESFIKEQDENA